MSGYQYEPGRMHAYGRAPVPATPTSAQVDPRYGWSPIPPPAPRPSRTGTAALVVGVAALVVAMTALAVVLVLGPGSADGGASGWGGPLTGRLEDAPTGALSGGTLQSAVSKVLLQDGGNVTQLTCPETPSVLQGVVTVCHATIDTEPWAVVVLFEDTDGRFTLDLI